MGFCDSGKFDPIQWSSGVDNPAPRLDQFVIDVATAKIVHRRRIPLLDDQGRDFPVDMPTFAADGAACRYSYFLGAQRPEGWFPFRSVVKVDLVRQETWHWDAGSDCICSEPMFLPRQHHDDGDGVDYTKDATATTQAAEDDGYVVSIVHNATAQNCELVVLDAARFALIAKIDLGELMPWCVHGSWVPDYVDPTFPTV